MGSAEPPRPGPGRPMFGPGPASLAQSPVRDWAGIGPLRASPRLNFGRPGISGAGIRPLRASPRLKLGRPGISGAAQIRLRPACDWPSPSPGPPSVWAAFRLVLGRLHAGSGLPPPSDTRPPRIGPVPTHCRPGAAPSRLSLAQLPLCYSIERRGRPESAQNGLSTGP